jgi:hypothetical protein
VRALSGLIDACGLLVTPEGGWPNKDAAYKAGIDTWGAHSRAIEKDEGIVQKTTLNVINFILSARAAGNVPAYERSPVEPGALRIGVWDTVGALGVPEYHDGSNRDLFRFADTTLVPSAAAAFHAVSVDERRESFTPTLWAKDDRVTQVLFPGAHADVGGGYSIREHECSLSDIAMEWMVKQLARPDIGALFIDNAFGALAPNPRGPSHRPWENLPFSKMPKAARAFPTDQGIRIHQSVLDRWFPGYTPSPLLDKFVSGAGAPLPGVSVEPY